VDFRKQGHDLLGLWIAFERCEECFYAVQACLPVGIFRQLPPAFSEHLSRQIDTIYLRTHIFKWRIFLYGLDQAMAEHLLTNCLRLGGAKPPPLGGSFSRFCVAWGT
jgi:hypothetical protein